MANVEQCRRAGKIGGSRRVPKGFAKMDKERLREISRKGGKAKRKGSKNGRHSSGR